MSQRRPRDDAPESDDLYARLQVSPLADAEVIEAAYRVLARRYHPDRNRSAEATQHMARLNVAWETLRDPVRRAAYDRERRAGVLPSPTPDAAPHTPEPQVRSAAATPDLHVEPASLRFGALRRGGQRTASAAIVTEPPGIRVEVAVADGSDWLSAGPATLKGLDKEQIGVAVRTRRLPPGRHRGAIALRTSWETRILPVEVEVLRPGPLYRAAALLLHGPGGDRWRGSTLLLVLLLLGIGAGLAALALGLGR